MTKYKRIILYTLIASLPMLIVIGFMLSTFANHVVVTVDEIIPRKEAAVIIYNPTYKLDYGLGKLAKVPFMVIPGSPEWQPDSNQNADGLQSCESIVTPVVNQRCIKEVYYYKVGFMHNGEHYVRDWPRSVMPVIGDQMYLDLQG